ncbi:MAG: TrkA C-terminal domain-containing protein [Victivallales bacterium]|nr:TrkA C-terminal domain-containing protein [Victivallales bacterium]
MGALLGLLIIISLSIVIIRIGAVALELTGVTQDVAAFQAQSAFTGAGFTTTESESIVSHPVRRKIARILILLGSAGLTSSIATLIMTFTGQSDKSIYLRLFVLGVGILTIYIFSKSEFIYRVMKKWITILLQKYTSLNVHDYSAVLGLSKGFSVSRFTVKPGSWMEGCLLSELNLRSEGLVILSINRKVENKEKFIGVPTGNTELKEGDRIVCYGREEAIKKLSKRPKGYAGDTEHNEETRKERKKEKERQMKNGYS